MKALKKVVQRSEAQRKQLSEAQREAQRKQLSEAQRKRVVNRVIKRVLSYKLSGKTLFILEK